MVGGATELAVRKLAESLPEASQLYPKDVLGGAQNGTSEALAHFILERLSRPSNDQKKRRRAKQHKLLYLVGDKTRDTLATILNDAKVGIELDAVQVYETKESPNFGSTLR